MNKEQFAALQKAINLERGKKDKKNYIYIGKGDEDDTPLGKRFGIPYEELFREEGKDLYCGNVGNCRSDYFILKGFYESKVGLSSTPQEKLARLIPDCAEKIAKARALNAEIAEMEKEIKEIESEIRRIDSEVVNIWEAPDGWYKLGDQPIHPHLSGAVLHVHGERVSAVPGTYCSSRGSYSNINQGAWEAGEFRGRRLKNNI